MLTEATSGQGVCARSWWHGGDGLGVNGLERVGQLISVAEALGVIEREAFADDRAKWTIEEVGWDFQATITVEEQAL